MALDNDRVVDLLTYIEQVEKLKIKPAFSVPTEHFSAFQHELKGLPEIRFNIQAEGEDIWLSIPRLKEIPPPEPDQRLASWITVHKSAAKAPELNPSIETPAGPENPDQAKERVEIRELFDWYVENQWLPWSATEQPRRKTIHRYNQIFALHQVIAEEGADTPLELVWGIGIAIWKPDAKTTLKYPLITQRCEVSLNRHTFHLEIRPRDVDARIELDAYAAMELSGVAEVESWWASFTANSTNRVNPFEYSTFEPPLKAAVGLLDSSGSYEVLAEDPTPSAPTDKLKITSSWVLFARKRTATIFLEDVKRLKQKVQEIPCLPAVIRSFVQRGDDEVQPRIELAFRGLLSSEAPAGATELYFPLPYNDEQVAILQKLEHGDGVVVQGPPGTGKTHTIANIISHYLAAGKRVLVASKGETALTEVIGKLPEQIRPLAVGLLANEREGMKQFEHSIQTIASKITALNPQRTTREISRLEDQVNRLHAKISQIDATLRAYAIKHMSTYKFRGSESSPEEIAKYVIEQEHAHKWMDDALPADGMQHLQFDERSIGAVRQARLRVGRDINYLESSLPVSDDFPGWPELLSLHRELVKLKDIDQRVFDGIILDLIDSTPATLQKAAEVLAFLTKRSELQEKVLSYAQLARFREHLPQMRPDDPLLDSLLQAGREVEAAQAVWRDLVPKSIRFPAGAEADEDFVFAIERLKHGKSAFALPFGKSGSRKLVQQVTILGLPASTGEQWGDVDKMVKWRVSAKKCLAQWNSVTFEFGLEPAKGELEDAFRRAVQLQAHITDLHKLVFGYDAKLATSIQTIFGADVATRLRTEGEVLVSEVITALQLHILRHNLASSLSRIEEIRQKLVGRRGPIVDEISEFFTSAFGSNNQDEATLQKKWHALTSELLRICSLRPDLDQITLVSAAIEKSGAPLWAARIRTRPAEHDRDPIVPADWFGALEWRCAVTLLDSIDVHHELRNLFEDRQNQTTSLGRTYQELVAEKSWLNVYDNSPSSVQQDLKSYLHAIQAMGTGLGLRARRYRKDAQEAMTRAYRAVPCWVLPQWRVSETIPAEIGLFDLVVIDEASQSDIWALPVLLRGKKLLIVGDHKQVSPSAIGMAEEKVKDLIRRFLLEQPFGAVMTPEKSIYDLASVIFASNSVMLREHFRCVPAVIEFSNREFYQNEIVPLRIPDATQRLDPPLIDVYVKGGFRKGDINDPEAQAVLQEIQIILADPALDGRSIGVVTLLGTEQAAHIHKLVTTHISPIDIVKRQIAVGPPPVFQGRERDIMLISMVLAPGDHAAQNRADQHQRFNVALSRAKDREYLFRSVDHMTFAEDSLNGKLIRHFKEPFRQDSRISRMLRERCESDFERDMFDELVEMGYRVEPQVRCGGFRIDFVVEGREGRRIAVECDGDRFHGPGQWAEDMARQRVLERAGWTFWRCFASNFRRNRTGVLRDLVATMAKLGIEPIGSDGVDNTMWVYSKEVDPYAIEQEEDDDLYAAAVGQQAN
jgi:very-short-patch-repair endonuclease